MGGFIIKFNGRTKYRCYSFRIDYDKWRCSVNEKEEFGLPKGLEKIEIKVESLDKKRNTKS